MKCPFCQTRAISFWQWGHGLHAFRHQCPHRGEPLKARPSTYLVALPILAAVIALIPFITNLGDHLGLAEPQTRALFAAIMFAFVLPTTALELLKAPIGSATAGIWP